MNERADQDLAPKDGPGADVKDVDDVVPFRISPSMVFVLQARNLERRLEQNLQEVGLSLRKFGILGHLSSTPGLSFTEIADRAGITVQSVHTIVGDLMSQELVRADGAPGRGRAATLRLSEVGRERIDAARRVVERTDEDVFGASAEREWQDLASTLRKLAPSVFREETKDPVEE